MTKTAYLYAVCPGGEEGVLKTLGRKVCRFEFCVRRQLLRLEEKRVMGKSFKKTPATSFNYNGSKRRANKRVRRLLKDPETSLNRGHFKRAYCSWDIRDYREIASSFETFYKDQVRRWGVGRAWWWKDKNNPPTKEACRNIYDRWYRRK